MLLGLIAEVSEGIFSATWSVLKNTLKVWNKDAVHQNSAESNIQILRKCHLKVNMPQSLNTSSESWLDLSKLISAHKDFIGMWPPCYLQISTYFGLNVRIPELD